MKCASWFNIRRPAPNASSRLICFPFAGGSASAYASWSDDLYPDVEVVAVQLPGRGNRFQEKPYTEMGALIQDLMPAILWLADSPVWLFGHSMGALIAYEVAKRMRTQCLPLLGLYVSGSAAPWYPHEAPETALLSHEELVVRLRRLNGVPRQVLENDELLDLLLPMIRADFALTANYRGSPGETLLCPVVGFSGSCDPEVLPDVVREWRQVTRGEFNLKIVEGDHFFVNSAAHEITQLISARAREMSRKTWARARI